MPRIGMEPIRREALVKATIAEIGEQGSLDVTVSRIARRAGVSSALAHHYFGGKDEILLAAMRRILSDYGQAICAALRKAQGPRARVEAVVRTSFGPEHFAPDVIAAWLNFYVHAQAEPRARRLLAIYQRRLRANLLSGLRPLVGQQDRARAEAIAEQMGALIDGIYIRQALGGTGGEAAARQVLACLDAITSPIRAEKTAETRP